MFTYWEGYEIDGSDTDFDIVLPEIKELENFLCYFLTIPLFGSSKPHFTYFTKGSRDMEIGREKFFNLLARPDRPGLMITVNCRTMDELSEDVQKRLYELSEGRDPHEKAYGKVEHPCMAPIRQDYFTRGNMTVSLYAEPSGTKNKWYPPETAEPAGYVHNEALLCANDQDYPCFTLNVGPGFYYEYAIYIIDYLRDRFPGLATADGLDCQNGWTGGCTYADSIYHYEKIQLPVRHSIRNTMKRLTEFDLACSYRQYFKRIWHGDRILKFRMVNNPPDHKTSEYLLTFSEYIAFAEAKTEQCTDPYSCIYDTAFHTLLPKLSRFKADQKIYKSLQKTLANVHDSDYYGSYGGYTAFTKIDGQLLCEMRIPWVIRDYFHLLLQYAEEGKIDFLKTETYERRHNLEEPNK